MRVLLVANTLPPADVSGVGEQVLQLAVGLRARGHEVEILGRGPGGARGPKLFFPLTVVVPTLRRVRGWHPDVVQVHESDGGLAALALALARSRFGRRWLGGRPRLVALQQVSYVEERAAVRPLVAAGEVLGRPGSVERRFRWFKAPLHITLGRLTAQLADGAPGPAGDRVLAPSAATARELARDYRLRYLPAVVPNATGGLTIPVAARPAAAERAGYLLFVGRLRIRKGVEVLLASLARLVRSGLVPRLLIAGDGEHRPQIAATVAALGLGEHVRLLGRTSAGEVRALLADAAALVVPSTYEGMPLVILEAMAAACPVVASRVSGIPEVVVDGEAGWLVPAEDPAALATALAELLGDPAVGVARGRAGAARVARYRPTAVADDWLRALGVEPAAPAVDHVIPPAG